MSIMQMLFGSKPAQQPVQNTPVGNQNNPANNVPNQQTKQTAQTDVNGVVPDQKEQSPLDKHKDLWQPPKIDPKTENSSDQKLTPQDIAKAAGQVDFTKILDQDMLKKVSAGGEEAVNAMAALMNKVASAAYTQSAVAAHKMVEAAVEDATNKFAEKVPDLIRTQSARSGLIESNPGFKNPVVEPIVSLIQKQVAEKYPQATPQELNKLATEILQGTVDIINKGNKQTTGTETTQKSNKKGEDVDWLEWVQQ